MSWYRSSRAGVPIGTYDLPSVAAIGWIPFYLQLADVPHNAYTASRGRLYDLLFDSGNEDPDGDLGPDGRGFFDIIDRHDCRGALLLDGLRVTFGPQGPSLNAASPRRLEYVGSTPLRYLDRGVSPPRKSNYPFHPRSPDVGGPPWAAKVPGVAAGHGPLTIVQRVEFRLGKLVEVAGGILSLGLRGAPYAWMEMNMTIRPDGTYRVELSGSAVPSQRLYVDWLGCDRPACAQARGAQGHDMTYDMLDAPLGEMEGFLHAGRRFFVGGAVPAPPRRSRSPLFYEGSLI